MAPATILTEDSYNYFTYLELDEIAGVLRLFRNFQETCSARLLWKFNLSSLLE